MVSLVFKTEQVAIQHLEGILRYKPDCYYQKFYLKFTSGFPDLMVGYKGEIAFYEVKILKTTLKAAIKCFEPIQLRTISRMQQSGINCRGLILESKDIAYLYSNNHLTTIFDFTALFYQNPMLSV